MYRRSYQRNNLVVRAAMTGSVFQALISVSPECALNAYNGVSLGARNSILAREKCWCIRKALLKIGMYYAVYMRLDIFS